MAIATPDDDEYPQDRNGDDGLAGAAHTVTLPSVSPPSVLDPVQQGVSLLTLDKRQNVCGPTEWGMDVSCTAART